MKTAVIILNRNLPEVTDALCDNLIRNQGARSMEIFVVEAGSDKDKLSRHTTWHADWEVARKMGLRVPRGFNYGLMKLWEENRFADFEWFFMLTNDTEFENVPVIDILLEEADRHPRIGILSPCSRRWGERFLLEKQPTRYFWYVLNTAYLMRRQYIESVMSVENLSFMNFLYDGENFRGYGAETELIAKGYANDWATAITRLVWSEENESHLKSKADLIKTEPMEENLRLYIEEGKIWMRQKYGFNSRWTMQKYAYFFYEMFFETFPEFSKFRV